ncbi:hypothetical protein HY061_01570 [Candidatus Azambacteria bacterium]|nr:hypothetical protein [Candidatus Azambacteria bacterium]
MDKIIAIGIMNALKTEIENYINKMAEGTPFDNQKIRELMNIYLRALGLKVDII